MQVKVEGSGIALGAKTTFSWENRSNGVPVFPIPSSLPDMANWEKPKKVLSTKPNWRAVLFFVRFKPPLNSPAWTGGAIARNALMSLPLKEPGGKPQLVQATRPSPSPGVPPGPVKPIWNNSVGPIDVKRRFSSLA
jgi:hypothetical protein